jgi:hypothetical protein
MRGCAFPFCDSQVGSRLTLVSERDWHVVGGEFDRTRLRRSGLNCAGVFDPQSSWTDHPAVRTPDSQRWNRSVKPGSYRWQIIRCRCVQQAYNKRSQVFGQLNIP